MDEGQETSKRRVIEALDRHFGSTPSPEKYARDLDSQLGTWDHLNGGEHPWVKRGPFPLPERRGL